MRVLGWALVLCAFTLCSGAVFERRGRGDACPSGAHCAPLSQCASGAVAASGRPGGCASAAHELSVCCAEDSAVAVLSSPNYRLRRAPKSTTISPNVVPGVTSALKPNLPSPAPWPAPRPLPSKPPIVPKVTSKRVPPRRATPPVTNAPSKRACHEYLQHNPRLYQPNKSYYDKLSRNSRALRTTTVVGGEKARIVEFPFMAAIGYKQQNNNSSSTEILWNCGGSLISDRYVLTAAHCITDGLRQKMLPVVIRTGVNHLQQGPRQATDYGIEATVLHPQHQAHLNYFDLALLRTDRPVSFSRAQRPVCLATPATRVDADSSLVVAGWGATDASGFEMSAELKKAYLRLVEPAECKKFFPKSKRLPRGLDDSMACAAEPDRQADTCNGDSGGPLVVRVGEADTLVGVTSFGGRPCAGRRPGVYARVAPQLRWIESVVWPSS